MAKHFITGGAGFIGSHLVDRLIVEGNKVTVYDNLVSGKVENIKHQFGKESFNFIQADLLEAEILKQAMRGHDLVWHLGANSDRKSCLPQLQQFTGKYQRCPHLRILDQHFLSPFMVPASLLVRD
jgi:nucleoside-diphosphate-sugar epimerase